MKFLETLKKAGKKFVALTMMSFFVLVAGLVLKPANIGAACTALATLGVAFMAGHTVTDMKHGGDKKDDDKC